jgi:hypothetical protein
MRLFTYCLLLAMSSLLAAQTSDELRARYGEPDRERFTVRPGITVEVEYGADHLVCRMLIGSPEQLLRENNSFVSSDVVTEILEELVPLTSRGNEINSMLHQFGCGKVRFTDYVNVAIVRSRNECRLPKTERELRASVSFKRDACQSQRK